METTPAANPDWFDRFQKELMNVVEGNSPSLNDVAKVIYEYGILDHISPLDPKEKSDRQERGKNTFERKSPELYTRIIYSVLHVREATKKNQTFSGYGAAVIGSAVYGLGAASDLNPQLRQQLQSGKILDLLVDEIISSAQKDYSTQTGEDHKIIELGTQVDIGNNATAIVDGYTPDGKIRLKPAKSQDEFFGYRLIGEFVQQKTGGYSNSVPVEVVEKNQITKNEFQKMAEQLTSLEQKASNGRGLQHVKYIIEDLAKGDLFAARVDAEQQSDKFDSIPEIKEWVIKNLFQDFKHPWESREEFYERLSKRETVIIDSRFDENKDTPRSVRANLIAKGYTEWIPPTNLTKTTFSTEARFETVQIRSPEEALKEVLDEAKEKSDKIWRGKVLVLVHEQNQKDAHIFIRPEIKRDDVVPGFNSGTSYWKESDGTVVAKITSKKSEDGESIVVEILKRSLPNFEAIMEEEERGTRQVEKIDSENPDYVRYIFKESHNWNLVFGDLKHSIDQLFKL